MLQNVLEFVQNLPKFSETLRELQEGFQSVFLSKILFIEFWNILDGSLKGEHEVFWNIRVFVEYCHIWL